MILATPRKKEDIKIEEKVKKVLDEKKYRKFIDTTPKQEDCILGERDYLGLRIYGKITDVRNIELLQAPLEKEQKFNNPSVAYTKVANTYKLNKDKYGIFLYEADKDLTFIDVDVFRQPALFFKENGTYCPFHKEREKYEYDLYWDIQDYRRRNGMTAYAGIGTNGKRILVHCPYNLYGFLNFAPINRVEEDDDAIDNEDFFEDDEEHLEDLAEIKLEELIANLGVDRAKKANKTVDFPSFFDGQYHLIIAKNFARLLGKNFFLGKARRKGMSYFNAWDLFNHVDQNPHVAVILAAYDKKYLIQGKGLMKMVYTFADFINEFTDWDKGRSVKNKEHLRFGYYYDDGPEEHGYKSEVLAVSAMNNPDVTIGKDVYELAYEEMGKFPNWKDSYEVSTSTAEAGSYKTGMLVGWGTGGTDEANWKDFEDVFFNPNAFDALACNNIWDTGTEGNSCCYFYAHVDALEGCMDYNGNTDYRSSWIDYFRKRKIKEESITDQVAFDKWCGQRANTPMEAFARGGTNIFNREKIISQLQKIRAGESAANLARYGTLVKEDNKIRLMTNQEKIAYGIPTHPPVNDFPLTKNTDVHGCYVEWFPPYRDASGNVPDNLYISWQDPYGADKDAKEVTLQNSLAATYIFETENNITPYGGGIPVAALIGRTFSMDDYNEQALLALQRFNAKLGFENNTGDTKQFMQRKKMLHMLFEEPALQFDRDVSGRTGRGYGIYMTPQKRSKGAIYLRDLLNAPIRHDSEGNYKTLYDYIFDEGFLSELLRWSLVGNFDRVSAWIVGTFFLKECEYNEIIAAAASENANNSFFDRQMYH